MATAYINIGSNLGDSDYLTRLAADSIAEILGTTVRRAEPVRSAPWGYESVAQYVNLGIAVEIGDTPPEQLFGILMEIEQSIDRAPHRNADGSYRDRRIDIDLIAVDGMTLDSADLTLPHPRMHLREFVLRPMVELAPAWRHPLSGLTPAEMLEIIGQNEQKGI